MPEKYLTGQSAGAEVSSTYQGRHIAAPESFLVHPTHTDGFVNKGDPVIWGENIVGVAFKSAAAATDQIDIDTEGIWYLAVVGSDDAGNQDIARGDEVFINKTNGILSANANKQSHARFGYALLPVTGGNTTVIAVKIHWNPDDAQELVGTTAAPETSAEDDHTFREYRYESSGTGSGTVYGDYLRLNQAGAQTEVIGGRTNLNISAAVAQAYGRHDTVAIKATGSITGLAVGHRAGYLASDADQAGTVAGGMSELFAGGSSTDYSTSLHSIHRFVNAGEATGLATAQNVFEFSGLSSTQWIANTDVPARGLRCIINGDIRWIMVSEATS